MPMKRQTTSLANLVGLGKKGLTDGSSSSNSGGLKRQTTSIADLVGFKRDKSMDRSADSHNSTMRHRRRDPTTQQRRVVRDGRPCSLEELEALTSDLERMALALGKVQDPQKILFKHVKKTPSAA